VQNAGQFKVCTVLMSITLLLLQRLVDLKKQFYGYLPAGYQSCRRGKRSTQDTAQGNERGLVKRSHENAKMDYSTKWGVDS